MINLNRLFKLLRDLTNLGCVKTFYIKPNQSQNHSLYSSSAVLNLTFSIAIIFVYIYK